MSTHVLLPHRFPNFNYITDFRKGTSSVLNQVPAPILDQPPAGQPQYHLKHMLYGGNGAATDSQPFSSGPDGLTVMVTGEGNGTASRTVYAVSTPRVVLKGGTPGGVFIYSPQLIAEVLFDIPNCKEATKGTTTWAVGLNFKTGTETDDFENEQNSIVGVTCQFVNGGDINFNGPTMTSVLLIPGLMRNTLKTPRNFYYE